MGRRRQSEEVTEVSTGIATLKRRQLYLQRRIPKDEKKMQDLRKELDLIPGMINELQQKKADIEAKIALQLKRENTEKKKSDKKNPKKQFEEPMQIKPEVAKKSTKATKSDDDEASEISDEDTEATASEDEEDEEEESEDEDAEEGDE